LRLIHLSFRKLESFHQFSHLNHLTKEERQFHLTGEQRALPLELSQIGLGFGLKNFKKKKKKKQKKQKNLDLW